MKDNKGAGPASYTGQASYDGVMIALHWLTAALVAALWLLAQVIDAFPRTSPMRVGTRSLHITLGVILVGILVLRLFWRARQAHRLPETEAGWPGHIAKIGHYLLYALLVTLAVSGPLYAVFRGDSIFGLFRLPGLSADMRWLRSSVGNLHGLAADTVMILAGGHALAALFHHFVLGDGILRRMLRPARSGARGADG